MENEFTITFPSLPARSCLVRFDADDFAPAAEWLVEHFKGRSLHLISDETVTALYGTPFAHELWDRSLEINVHTFPDGEENKTWDTAGRLITRIIGHGAPRNAAIIALGGGITGDIAGFVAASVARGIPWVQVPTTTLAMADSAIGGKTAVNISGNKNMAGAFHQPSAVFANLATLASLTKRHFRAGLAEIIKCALVADAGLFAKLETHPDALSDCNSDLLKTALMTAARFKAGVVAEDEHEAGKRAILNAGHTVAHAIEAAAPERYIHGEAVALGLVAECRLANRKGLFPGEDLARLTALLERFGFSTGIDEDIPADGLIRLMLTDKKNRSEHIAFSLPDAIGSYTRKPDGWTMLVEADKLAELLF